MEHSFAAAPSVADRSRAGLPPPVRSGCDRRSTSGGRGLRAREPAGGIVELRERRQLRRTRPDAVQARDPGAFDHAVAEALAVLVLAQLHVEADQLLEQPQEAGPIRPAPLERGA